MQKITIWAASAAIIAVVVGLYVMSGLNGNSNNEQLVAGTGNQEAVCAYKDGLANQIDKAAVGDIAAFGPVDKPVNIGSISFVDDNGNAKTLADWKGQLVLVNLWATWCPPCREEMPWFDALQKEKGSSDFEVVAISVDFGDAAKPKSFFAETGISQLAFFHDSSGEAFQSLKSKAIALGMPVTVLMDRNGCAIGAMNGPAHWSGPDAMAFVDQLSKLDL